MGRSRCWGRNIWTYDVHAFVTLSIYSEQSGKNEEINCYIYDPAFITKIKPNIDEDFQNSQRVSLVDVTHLSMKEKIKVKFAKLVEYYL